MAARPYLLAGLVGVVSTAFAQPVFQPIPPAKDLSAVLQQAVKDMASDDVILRMDAQRRLTEGASFRLRDIEAIIKEHKLEPEQRLRLESVAYKRFCLEPRAALGVQSGMQDMNQRGVLLSMVMPGFPSGETLRPGDRVLIVDGQTISDISLMRPVVIAHDPGDEVPVVLVRDGATITVKVKLGRYSDLGRDARGGMQAMTPDMLEAAWEFRCAEYNKSSPDDLKPIESGLTAADWASGGIEVNDAGVDPRNWGSGRRRATDSDQQDSEFVAAGEPRGVAAPVSRLNTTTGAAGNFRIAPGEGPGGIIIGPRPNDPAGVRQQNRDAQIAQIRQAQEGLRVRIRQNIATMKSAPDGQRRALAQENTLLQQQIDSLEMVATQLQPVAKP